MKRTSPWLLALILVALSLPALAGREFLVDADWLTAHVDDQNLVILEVRYHPHRYFSVGHIPGAVQVQRFKDLGDNDANPLMRFPSRQAFQATLRRWGVNDDSTVVIYDDSRTALASRLYFLLELYGYDMGRVKVLNGGTLEWTAFEQLSKAPVTPAPGHATLSEADPRLFVEWTAIYVDVLARRTPSVILLDARPHSQYTGEVVRHAVRGGHIPGAINVVSLDGTDSQSQTWLPEAALAQMYRGLPRDSTIYVYCHDGFRMSLAYMQLKSLGYPDVRLYNGGWAHWGNRLTLPVVEGPEPFDEAFVL